MTGLTLLAACERLGPQITGSNGTIAQIVVRPDSVALDPQQTQQFQAFGLTAVGDSVPTTVTWSASAGLISQSGLYTADTSASDVTITASLSTDLVSGTAHVKKKRVVQLVVMPQSVTLPEGAVQQFYTYGLKNTGDSVSANVTYTATGGTITPGGLYTAGKASGNFRVMAKLNGGSLTDSSAVAVIAVPVASVSVSPASASLYVGATTQLVATTKDSAGNILSGRLITWASSDTSVARVSALGLVVGGGVGSATITATSEGQSGTASVTVALAPVASVTVNPASGSTVVGGTIQLTAITKDSAGNVLTGRTITWATSNAGVATVSGSGLVTGVTTGAATITATSEGQSGTAGVIVSAVPVASVAVSPASASLYVGQTAQLTATTKDSAGNVLTGRTITWASSNTSVATVSGTGLVTAKAAGSATVTATSEGKSGTATITAVSVPVATVTISPASASVQVGATVQLTATTKDSAGNVLTGRTITWTTSAAGVATVSTTGLVAGVTVGSVTITATSEGKSGTSAITVIASSGTHVGWYASPSGTSGGDGSAARPWDLRTALSGAGGKIHPGDTLWLRGGTYSGAFSANLNGTATAPIVVRQYPGERATIDGGSVAVSGTDVLTVNGSYTTYWGFEIMESNPQRNDPNAGTGAPLRGDGVYVNSAHDIKLINLIVHDTGHGTYTENAAHNIEIYGWIIYNGGTQSSSRSDGHGIYIKNDGIGWKIARDNVIFDQFGFGIHGYAESGTNLLNLVFDGNVLFNNGTPSDYDNPNMQLGGTVVANNDTVTNNMVYFSPGVTSGNGNVRIGYSSTANGTAWFRNNYIVGGTQTLDVGYWSNLSVQSNTIVAPTVVLIQHDASSASTQHWTGDMHYHDPTTQAWQLGGSRYTFANWQSRAGAVDQASATLPSGPQVFVRPNRYEPGRATIVIYNWTLQSAVSVDVSGVVAVGNRYDVRNVQDIFGTPIVSGTYGGGTISIPMSGVTPPQPIGGSFQPLIKTAPNFDAFIVTSAP